MQAFYIDVELNRGITRLQVDEVSPELWDMPCVPQFLVDFYNGKGFITLTLQLEEGRWYDRNTRVTEDDLQISYSDPITRGWNPNYQSPLSELAIQQIGRAIARHMVIQLTAYMGLFVPAFPTPTLN
jgi:hypothetical protein